MDLIAQDVVKDEEGTMSVALVISLLQRVLICCKI